MENIANVLEEMINNEKDNLNKDELIDRIFEIQREFYENMDKDDLFLIYKNLILKL